ncbi:hypothetical protein D3C72_2039160 [compost metagenome]
MAPGRRQLAGLDDALGSDDPPPIAILLHLGRLGRVFQFAQPIGPADLDLEPVDLQAAGRPHVHGHGVGPATLVAPGPVTHLEEDRPLGSHEARPQGGLHVSCLHTDPLPAEAGTCLNS